MNTRMSFVSKFTRYLTGFTNDQVETPCTTNVNGVLVRTAPGLRLCDEIGLKTARRAGWIMSMKTLREYGLHENAEYFWDVFPEDSLRPCMTTMANALLSLEAERQGSLHVAIDADQRLTIMNDLYDSLLMNTGLTKNDLAGGYIVLRLGLEPNRCSDQEKVKTTMQLYLKKGTYPPVIVSKHAMAAMHRDLRLLEMEKKDHNSTVAFRPIHESTNIEENASGMNITDQISEIGFANDTVLNDLTNYMDKSVYDLDDEGEIEDISTKMNNTITKLRSVTLQVGIEKSQIDEAKVQLHETFMQKQEEIEQLNQIMHNQKEELKIKEEHIGRLEKDLDNARTELASETANLEKQLEKVTTEKQQQAFNTIPLEQVEEAQKQLADLEGQVKDRRENEQRLRRQIRNLKEEYTSKIAENQSAIDTATALRVQFKSSMDETKNQLNQLKRENQDLRDETEQKEKANALLSKRITELDRAVKQTSIRRNPQWK